MYFRTGGSFKSTNHKKLGPQITNPQRVTVRKSNKLFKSASLRIAICGTYSRTAHLSKYTLSERRDL
jgi:hypothetical protein